MNIYKEVWINGAKIEVRFHEKPVKGEDPSDRIHLILTDCDGVRHGWHMNIEDSIGIIHGLAKAVQVAIEYQVPVTPQED